MTTFRNHRFFLLSSFLLTLLLFSALPIRAAWQPIVRSFTLQDYAAGTQNWNMLQSSKGWVYAANNYGLLEYDGCSWHIYGVWNSSVVRSLAEGEDGCIFVGCTNDFGVFRPAADGGMTYESLAANVPSINKNFGEVWSLQYDEGNLYVQTRNLVFIYTSEGQIEVIDPASVVYTILVQDHNLYVSTANGVFVYTGGHLHPLVGGNMLASNVVSAMAPYDEHSFLIATDFAGLFIYDGIAVRPFTTAVDAFLRHNQLYSVAVCNDYLAFGTVLHGLVVTDKNGNNPIYVDRTQGLPNSTVLSLCFDADNNLWVGLDQGVALLPLQSPIRFLRDPNVSYGSGYTYAEQGDYEYYGTNQGLYWCRKNTTDMHVVEGSLGQVWRLTKVNGSLFCCHNRGLFVVNGTTLTKVPFNDGVWDVFPLDEQHVLAGTYTGFVLFQKEGNTYHILRRLRGYDETTLYATMDANGRLWVLSSNGVERLTINDDRTALTSTVMLSAANRGHYTICHEANRVLISASDYLGEVAPDGSLMKSERAEKYLSGTQAYNLISLDKDSNLIYVYDGRICVRLYDKHSHCLSSVVHEVLNDPRFYVGGFANLNFRADGKIVLGGVGGFYLLDVSTIEHSLQTSNFFIRRVKNAELGVVYGESQLADNRTPIQLPFGRYVMRVEYSSNLPNRQGVMFRTRLLPQEKEFSDWSTTPYRDVQLLADGHYTLEVCMHITDAEDSFGTIEFVVAKPWYRRWWAWLIYSALLLIAALSTFYFARQRLRISQERLAAEKEKEIQQQEIRILQLEHEKAQFDLKSKSRELNSALLNQVNRNELTAWIQRDVRRAIEHLVHNDINAASKSLRQLDAKLAAGDRQDKDWKRFEENFDFVNDQFIRKLTARFSWMNQQEKKLCVYIHMGLQTKEIAPLLNVTVRGLEMMRYRMRQKMQLEEQANLKVFFEELAKTDEK